MASSRVSGARLDQLLQHACEPAFWLNGDLKFIWVNHAWEQLTGHKADSVMGLVCNAYGPTRGGDLSGLGGSFYPPAEARDGLPAGTKSLIIHASGERLWRRIEFWPFHHENSEVFQFFGMVRSMDEPVHAPESESQRLRLELLELRDQMETRYGLDTIIGNGPAHQRLLEQVKTAANSTIPVLIVGDSGTGKQLLARSIHQVGPFRHSPFIPVDCSALPPEVLERELFGPKHDNGEAVVVERMRYSEGSTVFLDDVFALPRDLQERLVRALESGVRLIATTTTDPESAFHDEQIRPDFYYALTTLVIRLSSLRDRIEELPLLAQHFLERLNFRGGLQRSQFSREALKALMLYDWPGNIRELARVVADAHGRGEGDVIEDIHIPAAIRGEFGGAFVTQTPMAQNTPLDELLTQVERRLIENALRRAQHNKSRAAELLGISRPRLYRRVKELDIPEENEGLEETLSSNDPAS